LEKEKQDCKSIRKKGGVMSEYDQVKLSYYFKLFGNRAGGFETALWNCFASADNFNKLKLAEGFPVHFQVFMDWYGARSEREYFKDLIKGESNG